jgi:hypothetical protein
MSMKQKGDPTPRPGNPVYSTTTTVIVHAKQKRKKKKTRSRLQNVTSRHFAISEEISPSSIFSLFLIE